MLECGGVDLDEFFGSFLRRWVLDVFREIWYFSWRVRRRLDYIVIDEYVK